MKDGKKRERFSLKSQSCLLLKAKVLFLPLSKVLFLLIHHFIAFLLSQDPNRGLIQWSGIFFLFSFFYYFQRPWSCHPCSQFLSICFYWFYYSMFFKDCWILDTEFRLCLMYLNTHSFKKSEMYFEGHDETLSILLGILVIFPFQWVILASWTLCSLEALNLLAKPLRTLSLHFQVQIISLLF